MPRNSGECTRSIAVAECGGDARRTSCIRRQLARTLAADNTCRPLTSGWRTTVGPSMTRSFWPGGMTPVSRGAAPHAAAGFTSQSAANGPSTTRRRHGCRSFPVTGLTRRLSFDGTAVEMRFRNPNNPTELELREWAAEAGAVPPVQDWELVLSWGVDAGRLRLFAELAADPTLPNGPFFLLALYQWVSYAARQKDTGSWRQQYDRWLDRAGIVRAPAVKRWRHRARLIFQGIERFDSEAWWSVYGTEKTLA